ncbi:MAG TPA: wax ester/triacylglycerol synthase family O-acyltransferase [Candidatus Competibacteraceae bacterium]|nr:wax ester/triacylglycerol synthase family O-acyltransferase [Candidatus Competibacteraceae bacterium]
MKGTEQAMADRERMSSVDTAWLRMERPTNPMMITGVLVFERPMEYARLRETIETRFLCYRRFRQKAVEKIGGAYWEDDDTFDLDSHLHRIALPGDGGKTELQALASDLMSTPLDFSKPLWQFHLVEHYRGGSALIIRIHHCYADGIALICVLLAMTDSEPDTALPEIELTGAGQDEDEILARLFRPVNRMVGGALRLGKGLIDESLELLCNPGQLLKYARYGSGIAGEAARVALMADDAPTRFKGVPGMVKRVAWAEPLPLDEIKTVGRALGCSVNDILLSCVAGALRSYLLEHGDAVDGVELRAAVPVNLRPLEEAHRLGNHFGLVFLELPVGMAHPVERLFEVRRRMQTLKGSYQAVLALGLLGAVGMGPRLLQQAVLDTLGSKATAVMTNVPGPQHELYLAGARIAEMMFWVPQSGNIGMGVSILSYNGRVQFGLVTDKRLVPDPETVIGRFAGEFERLVLALLMAAWDGEMPADAIDRA